MTSTDDPLDAPQGYHDEHSSPLHTALAAVAIGWRVFPVHSVADGACSCGRADCENPGKHPRTRRGVLDASMDVDQVRGWWSTWPDAGVGLATGEGSGVWVLDVDPDKGGAASLSQIEAEVGDLRPALASATGGGGRHLFYCHPSGLALGNRAGVLPGLDVRGDGGYVILPPSAHRSGRAYAWEGEVDLRTTYLTHAPGALLERVTRRGREARDRAAQFVEGEPIPRGERDSRLTAIAGAMRRQGLGEEEMLAALAVVNERCDPPLAESQVEKIARSVARYEPEAASAPVSSPKDPCRARGRPNLVRMDEVDPEPVEWLWPDRLPLGKLSLLSGIPGVGKTTLTCDIAARVTRGWAFPSTTDTRDPGSVLLLTAEDGPEDTIAPRLIAAGADRARVAVMRSVSIGEREAMFTLDQVHALDDALDELDNPLLVVIDPVSAYMGEADDHKNADVRAALLGLQDLAAQRRLVVLMISHLRKASGSAIHATLGSGAYVAASRAAYMVTKDADDAGLRLFLPVKANLGRDHGGLAYRLKSALVGEAESIETSRIEWVEESVHWTADEALARLWEKERKAPGQMDAEMLAANEFVKKHLGDGQRVLLKKLVAAAGREDIEERHLKRALKAQGAKHKARSFGGPHEYWLPVAVAGEGGQSRAVPLGVEETGETAETGSGPREAESAAGDPAAPLLRPDGGSPGPTTPAPDPPHDPVRPVSSVSPLPTAPGETGPSLDRHADSGTGDHLDPGAGDGDSAPGGGSDREGADTGAA